MYVCMCVCVYVCMCVCVYVCMCVCEYVSMCACVQTHARPCGGKYVCIAQGTHLAAHWAPPARRRCTRRPAGVTPCSRTPSLRQPRWCRGSRAPQSGRPLHLQRQQRGQRECVNEFEYVCMSLSVSVCTECVCKRACACVCACDKTPHAVPENGRALASQHHNVPLVGSTSPPARVDSAAASCGECGREAVTKGRPRRGSPTFSSPINRNPEL